MSVPDIARTRPRNSGNTALVTDDEAARLIAARCPELSPSTLALIESALAGDVIPTTALNDAQPAPRRDGP